MSSQVREVEAKLLLKKHDRRVQQLRVLERGWLHLAWSYPLCFVPLVIAAFTWERLRSPDAVALAALFSLAGMLCVRHSVLSQRLDILIALLQQEGMLQSRLPASHLPDATKATTKP